MAEVRLPVRAMQLLGDQAVGRLGIRDAQQGFGQTHQRDAFRARKIILGEERVDTAAGGSVADGRDELACRSVYGFADRCGSARLFQQELDGASLADQIVIVDCGIERASRGARGVMDPAAGGPLGHGPQCSCFVAALAGGWSRG